MLTNDLEILDFLGKIERKKGVQICCCQVFKKGNGAKYETCPVIQINALGNINAKTCPLVFVIMLFFEKKYKSLLNVF